MLSDKKYKFLDEVLSYVKFPFDKDNIRDELKAHIEDKIDYYTEKGYDAKTAEELSINDMGNPKEIGTELNKQHSPLLGWVWKITNVMVALLAIFCIYVFGSFLLISIFTGNPINDIPKSRIVYKVHVDKKVKLDDRIIHFKDVVYEKNGDMNIFYNYYSRKPWVSGWSLGNIGEIKDNLGNIYISGSGSSSGGIITKSRRTVDSFSKEADTLIINYDMYNRKYRVEIPLQEGDRNE